MDEETIKKIYDNFEINKENNEMLKKLVFFQKWTQIYRIGYWIVIILTAFGALYFIKPLLSNVFSIYTGGMDVENFSNISNSNSFDLLKSFTE